MVFGLLPKKLSAALGAGIALPILAYAGYVPNAEQSESTVFALRFLYAGVPCICNFIAIIIAWAVSHFRRNACGYKKTN